jgi:hypothetical protein
MLTQNAVAFFDLLQERAMIHFFVMAGLVPAIHVSLAVMLLRRGCPGSQTSLRSLRKADCYARA